MHAHPAVIYHRHHRHHAFVIMRVGEEYPVPLTDKLRAEYSKMYEGEQIKPAYLPQITQIIKTIQAGRPRYEWVGGQTHVPWYVVGLIHHMECGSNFNCHLHNGDSLKGRTHNEPAGRPTRGNPPFSWEVSAVDALQYEGFDVWTDWSVAGTMYKLEAYNGFGSRNHGVPTPYLWAGTNYYSKGKYIKDGIWSPITVSQQVGAAPVLYTLDKQGVIQFPPLPAVPPLCETP